MGVCGNATVHSDPGISEMSDKTDGKGGVIAKHPKSGMA